MKLIPLDDRIVVKRLESEEKTRGGILLPDTAKEKSQKGEVVSVGRGKLLPNGRILEPTLKKGDRVFFGKYAGNEIKVEGCEYTILKESEILGKISD